MKMLYITYEQGGVKKKAVLDEARYKSLLRDTSVSNLILYPTQLLQEQNFSRLNNNDNPLKQILHG